MGREKGDTGKANGANGRRRANNTGTLERRGRKWLARWYVYTPQGKRIRKSRRIEADSLDEARAILKDITEGNALMSAEKDLKRDMERLQGVRAEIQRYEDARPALSLADMFKAFRASPERPQRCGNETLDNYETQVSIFVSWVKARYPEAVEMRQITREVAYAFLDDISRTMSPNRYNKYLSLLRLVWRVLGEMARCPCNPWEKAKRKPQPKSNGKRALTVDELTRVCSTLTGEMRVLFALGLYTGLRLGDCALMDWGKIDMSRRLIVTTPRKTAKKGEPVEIPIHPALYAILDETPATARVGRLLPGIAEDYARDSTLITDRVKNIFEAAGIQTTKAVEGYAMQVAVVGFHSLRHTFVSLMGNAGAPLALVQSIVGHSNPMMTAHYFHARTDALANAVGNLPALMGDTIDAPTDTETRPDAETRLQAFKAAYRALTDKERKAAQRWIKQTEQRRATA